MDIAQILRSEGFKVTPQRIAIYDALRGHHNHPTAEMIYHSLRPTHPSMSLATVYKTMEIFEKIGLVKVLEVGDERAHYDWDTTAHAHIRCVRCIPIIMCAFIAHFQYLNKANFFKNLHCFVYGC